MSQLSSLERTLLSTLESLVEFDSYQTEYDGRMYTICPSCNKQDGEHAANCDFIEARALIAKTKAGAAS